jgi:nucleotide-binding universal stress UspA family protein
MLNNILVPVDGSGYANRAIDYASYVASGCGAKIILLHAINYPSGHLPNELHKYAVSEHLDEPDEVAAIVEKILESARIVQRMPAPKKLCANPVRAALRR